MNSNEGLRSCTVLKMKKIYQTFANNLNVKMPTMKLHDHGRNSSEKDLPNFCQYFECKKC